MLEPDNDRLEDFFRKAAASDDVTFNEEDWKKLEARLDAGEDVVGAQKTPNTITATVVTATVLLFSALVLLNMRYEVIDFSPTTTSAPAQVEKTDAASTGPADTNNDLSSDSNGGNQENKSQLQPVQAESVSPGNGVDEVHSPQAQSNNGQLDASVRGNNRAQGDAGNVMLRDNGEKILSTAGAHTGDHFATSGLDRKKLYDQLILLTPAMAEKNKQKADVQLPGAEEVDTGKAETTVKEELASEMKHVATPRLSLLLSFAPDFSSTSNQYSTPGKAYGAMIHYHVMKRWSLSAGVIKNNKRYTGDGEDYKPPTGYWKYYTNGVVPYSIDGSCDILEFPVMLQYTIASNGKNRWLAGAGASSYLMQSESYRYNFEEPNPGAKEGWDSKRSSRFLFNMVNFTIGYERQLLPGLMAGIEPYVKIPLEEIGWSNVKLFSAGASVTLRYKILGRRNISLPVRSRGPDKE